MNRDRCLKFVDRKQMKRKTTLNCRIVLKEKGMDHKKNTKRPKT